MSSKKGRVVNSWRSPEKLLMKAIAVALYDDGLRGRHLEETFEKIVPHWRSYFSNAVSANALSQRADKARRYPREFEVLRPYWQAARRIARGRARVGKREMRALSRG
ncbi:MAG: hypothetical protein AB7K64_09560 [Variibacter sp.]